MRWTSPNNPDIQPFWRWPQSGVSQDRARSGCRHSFPAHLEQELTPLKVGKKRETARKRRPVYAFIGRIGPPDALQFVMY